MGRGSKSLENYDAELMLICDPAASTKADREQHLKSRPCRVKPCKGGFACRRHGTPVEDNGRGLWWPAA